jgi:flagellar motor component MotA
MRLSPIIGGTLAVSLVVLGILLGSPLAIFFDVYTVLIVGCLPVAFLLQAHGVVGLKTTQRAMVCWFSSDNQPPERLGDACCVAETGAKATLKGAHVCVMIGAIQILQATHGDNLDTLGPAMSVVVLSYFYAHCINFVFWWPLGRWLTQHAQASASDTRA